jgi:hypothetical protein
VVADCICLETCNRAELPLRARQDHLRHHRPDHHLPKGPRRGGGRPDHCARRRAAAGASSNAHDTATTPAHPAPIHHNEPVAQLLQGPHQGGLCRVPQQRVPALGPTSQLSRGRYGAFVPGRAVSRCAQSLDSWSCGVPDACFHSTETQPQTRARIHAG